MEPRKQRKENQTDLGREANRGKLLPPNTTGVSSRERGRGLAESLKREVGCLTWVPSSRPKPLLFPYPYSTRWLWCSAQKGFEKELRTPKARTAGRWQRTVAFPLSLSFNSSAPEPKVDPHFPIRQVAHSASLSPSSAAPPAAPLDARPPAPPLPALGFTRGGVKSAK